MSTILPPPDQGDTSPAVGDPRLPGRFWAKISVADGGCWQWTAQQNEQGYGRYQLDGRSQKAHRVSYTALVGPIPDGLTIDHLCYVRDCVNPAHLEPVTMAENVKRRNVKKGTSFHGNGQSEKTHCIHGHPFDEANTFITKRGHRRCMKCHKAYQRRYNARRAAAVGGGVR